MKAEAPRQAAPLLVFRRDDARTRLRGASRARRATMIAGTHRAHV